jgi:hypothetical protein
MKMAHLALVDSRQCHWDWVDGPRRDGRAVRVRVWVCEFPYRTIRREGPDPDCEGCRRAMAALRNRKTA